MQGKTVSPQIRITREAMFLEPTVAEFPPPWQHCCHRTAEEMPMLVNLYSWEWLQTYSREVEMHIYKEGDQITAQSHVLDQVRWRDAWVFPAG